MLERRLKPFTKDHKHDWDKVISYLMFAHREFVNASMLFSPAEIVYGRNFRGPLHVMHEVWTAGETAGADMKQDVLTYMAQMRERLQIGREKCRGGSSEVQAVL